MIIVAARGDLESTLSVMSELVAGESICSAVWGYERRTL